MSCAFSLSAARPSCSVRETILRSSCCRSSSLFLNVSNFFLSMGSLMVRLTPRLIGLDAMVESKMISAKEKQRQLREAVASTQYPDTVASTQQRDKNFQSLR